MTSLPVHATLRPEGFRNPSGTLIATTLAIGILSLALPVATLQVYDRVLPNQSSGTLMILVLGIAVAMCLEFLLRLARAYLIGFSGAAYVHGMSCTAVRHLLAADVGLVDAEGRKIDFQHLGAIRSLKEFHNGNAVATLVDLIFVPIFLVLIAHIAGALVLVPLCLLSIFALFSLYNGLELRKALAGREAEDDRRYSYLVRTLNAVHSVKALAMEHALLRRYEKLQGESCIANFGSSDIMTRSFNTGALFAQTISAATIGFGAISVIDGRLTVGGLIAVVLLSGRVMQPVHRALVLWVRYQDGAVSKLRVERIFQAPLVIEEAAAASPGNDGVLEIEDLGFGYGEAEAKVIEDINLTLRPGEAISIAGGMGSGKSTLLRLIAGLHRPQKGRILINGLESTRFPPQSLKEHIGLMSTDGTIFRGTIRDNITCFGEVPSTQAMFVAGLLGVDEEIARLPGGLETRLEGTGADSIPPGLKQRIALVRVLASKPRILLFDGADRSLDVAGYRKVHWLLGRLKPKTAMILVSDDKNLQTLADRHFELVDGRLVERAKPSRQPSPGQSYRNLRI